MGGSGNGYHFYLKSGTCEAITNKDYFEYVALLSQGDTNAPTAVVLKNDIGSIGWSRIYAGMYKTISDLTFDYTKTFLNPPTHVSPADLPEGIFPIVTVGTVLVQTLYNASGSDSMLDYTPITIRDYSKGPVTITP